MTGHLHQNGAIAFSVAVVCLGIVGLDLDLSHPDIVGLDEATCSSHGETINKTVACGGNLTTYREAGELWKIDGLYYDLRPLLSWHPGSQLPLHKTMGTDASTLFRIQHLSEGPRLALQKYQVAPNLVIGSIDDSEHSYLFEPEGFYMTLRSRVSQQLADMGVTKPRQANVPILMKINFNLVLFLATWYQINVGSFSLVACVLNLVSRLVLTGAAHEAMHGSVIPQLPYTQHFYAKLVVEGLLGFPLESWWHEHVLLHHLHTKTEVDPDENIHQGVPIWRLTNATSWSKLHSFPVTSHALVGLLHPHLRCFAVESWRLQQSDSSVRAGYALVVIAVLLLHWLPLFVQKNKRKALLSIFLSSMLASMMTMFAFHVNHLFPEAEGGHDQLSDWGERQLITTTNFYSGFNAVSGGLDLQIEHHLFPMLSYNYQQAVQATIKEVAEEFNLPYRSYTSLGSGLIEHFAYMVELGKNPIEAA